MAARFAIVIARSDTESPPLDPPGGAWACHVLTPRTRILTNAACPVVPHADGLGMTLGFLMRQSPPRPRVLELSPDEAARVRRSRAEEMLTGFWGSYVTVLDLDDGVLVLRDPSGGLPCHIAETAETLVLASDLVLLKALCRQDFRPDWAQVRRHLAAFDLRASQTALCGVRELMPGEIMTVSPKQISYRMGWTPWSHTRPATGDAAELADGLRDVVTGVLHRWADLFEHILLNVSGGLDSSIVAAVLSTCGKPVTCLTFATDDAEGDERAYARQLTTALGLPLIETFHRLDDVDVTRTGSAHLPRPVLYSVGQSEAAQKTRLVQTHGIDALVTGIGGDNVFCNLASAAPLVDRLRHQGLGRCAWQTLLDLCDLTTASLFEVMAAAAPRLWSGDARYPWATDTRFLRSDPHDSPIPLDHLWFDAPTDALPGKAAHIGMLTRIQATIDSYDRQTWPAQLHPLLSQPIVEYALSVPSWQWVHQGRDRAIARLAFSGQLPASLIQRRSKAGPDRFAHLIIKRNRAAVRNLLIDGLLAQNGVLDRAAVASVLEDASVIAGGDHLRLLMLCEAETWARHWSR